MTGVGWGWRFKKSTESTGNSYSGVLEGSGFNSAINFDREWLYGGESGVAV